MKGKKKAAAAVTIYLSGISIPEKATKDAINYVGDKTIGRTFEKTYRNTNKRKTLSASVDKWHLALNLYRPPT